jgi:hypothetical protein
VKRFILGAVGLMVALAACSPGLTAPPDNDPATLRFAPEPPGVLFYGGGPVTLDFTLTVSGDSLRINAPQWCKPDQDRILCTVPVIPAGKNFILSLSGSNISAVARYKRQSGGQEFVRRTQ